MRSPRGSGILLHPTSLPGPHGSGDVGEDALRFLDWLKSTGQSLWQMLPLCPTGYGNSPYSGLSAFAANPLLVNLGDLARKGWLSADDLRTEYGFPPHRLDFENVSRFRNDRLRRASHVFFECEGGSHRNATRAEREDYEQFCEEHASWLEDFCLFMALDERHGHVEWSQWERPLALREPQALKEARRALDGDIRHHRFTQWRFFRQWAQLRGAARERGVRLMGDLPIFVAYHSADVWARPELFHLDDERRPTVVAGVPPDYFSATGQRWGNPLYRWDVLAKEGYGWWIDRIRATLALFDLVRIDHFRGFASYWEIPASEPTAIHGRWQNGPGDAFFEAVRNTLGDLPIVAEDLGMITPDVIELRKRQGLPGMKVLHFAFGSGPANPFLPHNHESDAVVYTGTHDNDVTSSWYATLPEPEKQFMARYLGRQPKDVVWELMHLAAQSVADTAIYPFQDVLGLGAEGRMNRPGEPGGNWGWRFSWDQLTGQASERLRDVTDVTGRIASPFADGQ